MNDALIVFATAFLLDMAVGDPHYPLHPVRMIGWLLSKLESLVRGFRLTGVIGGAMVLLTAICVVLLFTYGVTVFLAGFSRIVGICVSVWVVASCFAVRDMVTHARAVNKELKAGDTQGARSAVQMIVGRDAARLDVEGVARATVESVAESFIDSFFSPVCWFVAGAWVGGEAFGNALAGAVGAIVMYRVVNTSDSMFGYRNELYERFGRVPARFDDVMNFLPARLSLLVMVPAALLTRTGVTAGVRAFLRDRLKHKSPNAGHSESFFAGALGVRLGGPTIYPHGTVEKPWLGTGTGRIGSGTVTQAVRLYVTAAVVSAVVGGVVLVVICNAYAPLFIAG